MEQLGFLKNMVTGNIFRRTDILEAKPNMLPCDAYGTTADMGETEMVRAKTAAERVVTRYLGNPENGILFNYSAILAQRPSFISINTKAEWEDYKDRNKLVFPNQDKVVPLVELEEEAPTLGRTTADEAPVPAAAAEGNDMPMPEAPPAAPELSLPDIDGIAPREAKTILSDWSHKHFGQKLNRRISLEELIVQCETMIEGQQAAG